MTSRATVGEAVVARTEITTNQGFCNFLPSSELNALFLAYWLRFKKPHLVSLAAGSTFLEISKGSLRRLPIDLPPLPEQKKIAVILSSVDDAIQATQAVIDQTREVKKGLLQELLTRGIGPDGRPHTRLKKTEIGEIPESWRLEPLNTVIVEGPRNGIYLPAALIGSGILLIGQTAFTSDRRLDFSRARRASIDDREVRKYGLRNGDILVTRVYATPEGVGRPVLVSGVREPAVFESNMIRVRPDRRRVVSEFLFYWLQLPRVRSHLMGMSGSSNQTSINQTMLGSIPCGLPDLPEQERITSFLLELENVANSNRRAMKRLKQTKAGLLQDLLTGKVRVTP